MRKLTLLVLLIAMVTVATAACGRFRPGGDRGDLALPPVFGNHMVLQRDIALPVWGWADPGSKITVSIDGQSLARRNAVSVGGGKKNRVESSHLFVEQADRVVHAV